MTEDKTGEPSVAFVVGLSAPESQGDASTALHAARADGYDYVTTEITNTPRVDVTKMAAVDWSRRVVGIATSSQFDWAHHMNLPAVLLPPVVNAPSYAQALAQKTVKVSAGRYSFQLWVPIKLRTKELLDFQVVYKMCGENHHISSALFLDPIDSAGDATKFVATQLRLLHMALGCNIRCVVLPTSIFLTNKRGYPTLAKATQTILTHIMCRIGRTVRFLVQGPSMHQLPHPASGQSGCLPYLQYLHHIRKRQEVVQALDTEVAQLEVPYLDVLQRPLQPLKDHLEFGTYEVFEKDPVKYQKYKEAIRMALIDFAGRECRLFVVGAGRGPLVACAFIAYQEALKESNSKLQLRVFAIEKNPSAMLFLQARMESDPLWRTFASNLHLIQKDLRNLRLSDVGDRPCDVVVSELLGSFGDNELSPECLNAFYASDVCDASSTISIPHRYVAYLSLLSSATLHLEARNQALYPNDEESGIVGMQQAMETPYVVRPHAASQMFVEQPCWAFEHPHGGEDTCRQVILDFAPTSNCDIGLGCGYGERADTGLPPLSGDSLPWTLSGLIGSFTAQLYSRGEETCQISTAPTTFSTGMFSWFPLFFPLKESVFVPPGANVRVHLWRRATPSHIWYEWSVSVYHNGALISATEIHNPSGRSYSISMST